MERGHIRDKLRKYDDIYAGELRRIEDELNAALSEQGYITPDQLRMVFDWKFDGMPGRGDYLKGIVRQLPEAFVVNCSKAAFVVDEPKTQLDTLTSIPGVGDATASVILAFYDPERYCVGDRYIVHALLGEQRGMRATDYPKLLEHIDDINTGEFTRREVEKAVYQEYRDTHGKGRFGEER